MKDAAELIYTSAARIFPSVWLYMLICLAAVFALIRRKTAQAVLAGAAALLFMAVFFCPLTALFFGRLMREGEVYWRLFWPVPYLFLIAYAGTEIVFSSGRTAVRLLLAAAVCAAVVFGGRGVYRQDVFQKAVSREKLPQITMTAVSVINENAEKTGNSYKKVSAPIDIRCQIRQVDATIYGAASRYFHREGEDPDDSAVYYHNIVSGIAPDTRHRICLYLEYLEANYVVTREEYGFRTDLEKGGFDPIYEVDGWEIWYSPSIRNTKHTDDYA